MSARHEYQAKPGDAQAIANADVLIKNGLEIEFFLDDMIENAGNANLAIIDTSEGIPTLASADEHGDSHAEGDDHGHAEGDDHGHSKEEGHDHAEDEKHDHAQEKVHAEGEGT